MCSREATARYSTPSSDRPTPAGSPLHDMATRTTARQAPTTPLGKSRNRMVALEDLTLYAPPRQFGQERYRFDHLRQPGHAPKQQSVG